MRCSEVEGAGVDADPSSTQTSNRTRKRVWVLSKTRLPVMEVSISLLVKGVEGEGDCELDDILSCLGTLGAFFGLRSFCGQNLTPLLQSSSTKD